MKRTSTPGGLNAWVGLLLLLVFPEVGEAQYQASPPPAAYAIENATVVHADGSQDAGVNLVVRRGLIQAMAPGAPIPPDAQVLDGASLWIYPGMVDAHLGADFEFPTSFQGDRVLSWAPPREAQGFTPHRRVASHLTGGGSDFRSERIRGVIAAGVHPTQGMAPGQGAGILLRKTTRTPWDLVTQPRLGLFFSFQGARGGYPSSLFAVVAYFRQMFEDAAHHGLLESEFARNPAGMTAPPWDPDFEALREAASGGVPVYFQADDDEDVRRVLALSDEIGFRPIIMGGEESWQLAGELGARGVPVLLSVAFPEPGEWNGSADGIETSPDGPALEPAAAREKERLENAYSTAARLEEAGVTLALTSGGGQGDLREGARKAIQYGLSESAALRALTSTPADLLGMPSLSSLTPGMAATFIVTDGPLFDESTEIRYTFVEGELEPGRKSPEAGAEVEPAVDVTGTWSVSVVAQGMEMSFVMVLVQDGASFSGSMTGGEMGDALVKDGLVSGDKLTFTLVFSMGTETLEMISSATAEGDRVTGSGSSAMGGFTFTGTREPGKKEGAR